MSSRSASGIGLGSVAVRRATDSPRGAILNSEEGISPTVAHFLAKTVVTLGRAFRFGFGCGARG